MLGELDAEQRLHQRGVGQRRAEAGERRRDLRVEQAAQRRAAGAPQDRQVARPRVQQLAPGRIGEERAERRQVGDPHRVDQRDLAGDGDLDDAEPRAVGPLEDELGVEGDVGRGGLPAGGGRGERVGTIDPGGGSRHQKRTEY